MAAKISLPVMEEKRPRSRPRRRHRPLLILTLVAIVLYALYSFRPISSYAGRLVTPKPTAAASSDEPSPGAEESATTGATKNLVPLEAHIMSKCPDAKDCLKELVLPAMMRVYEKVNFTLSYIGTPTENDGVECMHGPNECMGNIIELCAHQLYPDPKIWLGFTMCLTRDYKQIPQRELVEDCALEHAIDFDKLNDCAAKDDGAFGMGMLRSSVQRSANVRRDKTPGPHALHLPLELG
ncbi:Uu.00g049200.m01.CDS01 [Anthostomella pinea]|uniref:Uu.00g049200.m01.CDS01 n=1 Tax=Anthostomella pinea TaxID=933095 RepID=A0AAI8YES5_9PEZI|nr:Uu.00g049200.m01.CDS01 [Anthostomella pinea]